MNSGRTFITCPCDRLCWKSFRCSMACPWRRRTARPVGSAAAAVWPGTYSKPVASSQISRNILLERAGQWPLTDQPRWAYDQAELYYDRAWQLQQRQPPGSYSRQQYLRPLLALLRLSLRRRQEERFYAWWDHCGGLRRFHRDVQALFQVRWLIVKEDYDRAAFQLRDLHGLAGRKSAFSPARARILSDIVTAALHGPGAALKGTYGPYVRQVLWDVLFPEKRDK